MERDAQQDDTERRDSSQADMEPPQHKDHPLEEVLESAHTRDRTDHGESAQRGSPSGRFCPSQCSPSRNEIEADLDKCVILAENHRPFYSFASHLDRQAWKRTPLFSGTKSHWDTLKTRFKNQGCAKTGQKLSDTGKDVDMDVSQNVCRSWRWSTCMQPPRRQEIKAWIAKHLEGDGRQQAIDAIPKLAELPTITEEPDYVQRPDSPDYDETSTFFFTPRSLTALTRERKSTTTISRVKHKSMCYPGSAQDSQKREISVGKFENLSDLSGTSASNSSRLKKQRGSETGFKIPSQQSTQQLVVCCIEVHAASRSLSLGCHNYHFWFRNELLPDPRYDAVHCIVMSATKDGNAERIFHKVFIFYPNWQDEGRARHLLIGIKDVQFQFFKTERALFAAFVQEMLSLDPDILAGFEMQKSSLGYLAERALFMEINLLK